MTSTVFEILGMIGSLIVCMSIIPQVMKTYRTRSARDLSIVSLSSLMTGLVLMMIYSVHIQDLVFIFGNTLSIVSILILMVLWRHYHFRSSVIGKPVLLKRKEQNPCRL